MKFLSLLTISMCLIGTAFAQTPSNSAMAGMLSAKNKQLPGLGMTVVSLEENNHILASSTGRYIIKGTLRDNWDGVQTSGTIRAPYPTFPPMLDINEIAVVTGNKDGRAVTAFVSYSCQGCEQLIKQLFEPAFLEEHRVNIIPVYNSEEDQVIARHVYCSDDKLKAFEKLYVDRDLTGLTSNCLNPQPEMNVSLANAFRVPSLPATFKLGTNQARLGPY